MTYRYMLDTNAVSDTIKNPTGRTAARLRDLPPDAACISIVTASELRFGARKASSARLWQKISDFVAFVPILSLEHPVEELYARIRTEVESVGRPIGPNDLFIAAHALALDLTLITANIREFSRVSGLRVENWLE